MAEVEASDDRTDAARIGKAWSSTEEYIGASVRGFDPGLFYIHPKFGLGRVGCESTGCERGQIYYVNFGTGQPVKLCEPHAIEAGRDAATKKN
ncbi:MAG: hypothetical protein RIB98_00360 [Acidimicrobiales bacterium]